MQIVVAALFVQTNGAYFNLEGVDPWDEERDARKYAGPHPVIAHPPCQRWGSLAKACYGRYKREDLRPGNDGGCFASALSHVRNFGGVLEHPAKTLAWQHFGLSKPVPLKWSRAADNEWVCEVWQSAYGHRANKATWLLYVGNTKPPEMRWDRPRGTHQVGFRDRRGKEINKPTLPRGEASATPPDFRDTLIALARRASV